MGLYLKFTQPMRVCGLSGKSKALHATPYFVDSCTLFGVAMLTFTNADMKTHPFVAEFIRLLLGYYGLQEFGCQWRELL